MLCFVYAWNNPQGGSLDIAHNEPTEGGATEYARRLKWDFSHVYVHVVHQGLVKEVTMPSQPEGETGPWLVYAWDQPQGGPNDLVSPLIGFVNWDDAWNCAQANINKANVVIMDCSTQTNHTIKP